jgi:elongation factor G
MVIDAAVAYLPGPLDVNNGMLTVTDIDDSEKTEEIAVSEASPLAALAFKIATDPFVGRLAFTRVYAGVLKSGSYIYNATTGEKERVGRLLQMHANTREEIQEIAAGHI